MLGHKSKRVSEGIMVKTGGWGDNREVKAKKANRLRRFIAMFFVPTHPSKPVNLKVQGK